MDPVIINWILSPASNTKVLDTISKEAYAGTAPKVIRLYVAVDPDLIRLAVEFTAYPEPDIKVELAICIFFNTTVELVGQVSNDPEAAYELERILLETDADKFKPMFLYVFGIFYKY